MYNMILKNKKADENKIHQLFYLKSLRCGDVNQLFLSIKKSGKNKNEVAVKTMNKNYIHLQHSIHLYFQCIIA